MSRELAQHGNNQRDEFHVQAYSAGDLTFHILGGGLNLATQLIAIGWFAIQWRHFRIALGGILIAVCAAVFVADFVSGVLHWAFDTWWSETTPILGRMVVMVREHHVYPGRIFTFGVFHDAGTLSWITFGVTLPIYLGIFFSKQRSAAQLYCALGAVVFTVLIVFMLEFHKAGHSPCAPRWVRILQRSGLILSTRHHLAHHKGLHDRNYCLINGLVDRTLGAMGMWRAFERGITLLTGAIPASDDVEKLVSYGRLNADKIEKTA